jgi:uncharacterized cupredoxin-like copper-binding protein
MKLLQAALVLSLACVAPAALAHGSNDKTSPVTKEQKPWGIAGDAHAARRTITVTMSDTMRFSPQRIDVHEGETVRFVIRNQGKMLHEFVLGTRQQLDEHAALMVKFPGMEHDEPYMAHVAAGKAGQIVWNFNRAVEFDFACLIAGHYQAGMVGKVTVAKTSAARPGTSASQ